MVVLVGGVHAGTIAGVEFAKSLESRAPAGRPHLRRPRRTASGSPRGGRCSNRDVELEIVVDPYRNLRGTVLRYVELVEQRWDDDRITVVIPEFVVHRWWEHLLHNQAALFLKGALLFRENVAVVSVPYQVVR